MSTGLPPADSSPADLAIIGAGPAGLAAAMQAATLGLSVVLLDENPAPGGRIWQALETRGARKAANPAAPDTLTDTDDAAGLALMRQLRASPVRLELGATVWAIEPGFEIYYSRNNTGMTVSARIVLLATGTTERPVPIAGWTLPGVMTIGAAQIALKTAGLVPQGRAAPGRPAQGRAAQAMSAPRARVQTVPVQAVPAEAGLAPRGRVQAVPVHDVPARGVSDSRVWLAGQGPLLQLYALQALQAGGNIAGIIDLSDGFAPLRALRHLRAAAWPDISRGLAWRRRLSQAGVPWIAASALRAEGEGCLQRIAIRTAAGWRTEAADTLLLHDGVIPSVQITRALGCAHTWNAAQHCWQPVTNQWGETSVPGILVAGDGGGIGGVMAAVLSGRIAVLGLHPATRAQAAPVLAERTRRLAVRPFLDALFPPLRLPVDDATTVCRCEQVPAAQIRQAARAGCQGMNQLKAYTRCGMGPCQGRMCGPVAARVLAEARGVPVAEIEPLRTRFPTKPVSVEELVGV